MIDYNNYKDEKLVELIQQDSNTESCLKVLIDRHSGLCVNLINNYFARSHNQSTHDELMKDKNYQIYSSALKYNPNKGSKFSTYLGNEVKWKCLNLYNKNKKRKTITVEEDLINYFGYSHSSNEDLELRDSFKDIIKHANLDSDQRVSRIFHLRYVVGKNNNVMPWQKISEDLGMSIQGCINIHDSAIKKIKNKIKKESYE